MDIDPAPLRRPIRRRLVAAALVAVLLVGFGYVWWTEPLQRRSAPCANGPLPPPSTTATEDTWPRYCDRIEPVIAARGIPRVDPFVERQHLHQHLVIEIRGTPRNVPGGVGLDRDNLPVSPLHTHSADGLLHVESPVVRDYRLVEFMAVWGVRLDDTCIAGYCRTLTEELAIFVNRQRWTAPVEDLVLADRQTITILFGDASQTDIARVDDVDWSQWDVA